LKDTLNDVLAPAARFNGVVMPLTLNPVPEAATFEIETLDPPVFVMVSVSVEVCPTVTFPKLRFEGLGLKSPGLRPVPDSGIASDGFEPFDVTVKVPLSLPADVGSNETVTVVLAPDARFTGVVMPPKVKPVPLIATLEIVRLDPPVLVMVSVSDSVWFTVSLPKAKVEGLGLAVPGVTPVPVRGMAKLGFDASEVIVKDPVTAPLACGANFTVAVVLAEGFNVSGVAIPLN